MRQKLSDTVRLARCARGWTQVVCARRAKVSPSIVADIERGAVATITQLTASKLERALGVSLSNYVKKSA